MSIVSKVKTSPALGRRGWLLGTLGLAAMTLLPGEGALAQGTTILKGSGESGASGKGAAGKGGGESGGGHTGGGESGGGHTGGGESGGGCGGGGCGGSAGGESGHSGNPQGKTPGQRAVRHRQQTGRTLGGGEDTGGHTGGSGHTGGGGHSGNDTGTDTGTGTGTNPGTVTTTGPEVPSDGSITGPIGGSGGGEHFVHPGTGGWGADTKVLRRP